MRKGAGAGSPPSGAEPRTQAELFAELARAAYDRGQEFIAAGDFPAAEAWLGRAHRFAPEDLSLSFALGMARLQLGRTAEAATLLERVAEESGVREAWFARAGAEIAAGRTAAAARSLHRALSRYVLPPQPRLLRLLDTVCARADQPGWCALDGTGRLRLGGTGPLRLGGAALAGTAAIRARIDGRAVRLAVPEGGIVPLPRGAEQGGELELTLDDRPLLGSPLDLRRLRRVEGCVALRGRRIVGWAWVPADPDRSPRLTLCDGRGGKIREIVASDLSVAALRPLARPRGFRMVAPRGEGMLRVRAADGRDLAGSPFFATPPGPVTPVGARPPLAVPAPRRPRRPVAVVVPVYGGGTVVRECLEALLASLAGLPAGTARVVVVDDASPEPDLVAWLDALARRRRILLLRRRRNGGFVAAANEGLRAACALPGRRDVVLLNSDTRPLPGWLEGLRAVVHADGETGTATALSNDAAILSYPERDRPGPAPEGAALARLVRLAARVNAGEAVEIPTAVGFCMYVRRECLDAVGMLREDVFAQGYGEENDFCLRARARGWRHVAAPGVYVAHRGGASFGATRETLMARNLEVLETLHPGYRALVAAHVAADPLAPARARLDAARLEGARRPAVLLLGHDSAGGVERAMAARVAELAAAGRRALLLRPVRDPRGSDTLPGIVVLGEGIGRDTPNLRFALPEGMAALTRQLRRLRVEAVEVHHLLGHPPAVMELPARLGVPYEVVVHDYAWICPRISLMGAEGHYCGEPADPAECDACVARTGAHFGAGLGVAALRARSAAWFAGARAVRTPSADAAARLRRYFPALVAQVARPEEDGQGKGGGRASPPGGARTRVCVVGGIGPEKGFEILLACARDAAERDLPLEFVLVGHAPDDAALLESGRVFVTGPYARAEAVAEIAAQRAHFAFLPSVVPETWCFVLGEIWQAGLEAVAFDLGAQAERIRARGRGRLLPFGLPPAMVNNALLAVRRAAVHEGWP